MTEERLQALKKWISIHLPDFAPPYPQTERGESFLTILNRALTTQAYADRFGGRSNEGLEFSGDAFCELAALEGAMELHRRERRPHVLQTMVRAIVNAEYQTSIAHQLQLDTLLLIPLGYKSNERPRKIETIRTLDGNAFEAVVGAIGAVSVKRAIEFVKRLTRHKLQEVARRVYNKPTPRQDCAFATREELFGHARLRVYFTRELIANGVNVRVYGLHRAREQWLKPRSLAQCARKLSLAHQDDEEAKAVSALLFAASRDRKMAAPMKAAVKKWAEAAIKAIEDEQAYLIHRPSDPGRVSRPPAETTAESALKTLLNGHALPHFETRSVGGGEQRLTHVVCFVNNQRLGEGRDKDPAKARELAAKSTLTHPDLEKVRRGTT